VVSIVVVIITPKVSGLDIILSPAPDADYLRIENAEGYVLIAVYLFICMRVPRITQKVLNRIA